MAADERDAVHPIPQAIEVHIDELILHGFPPADRHPIGGAVERELARLFAGQGLPRNLASGSAVGQLDGGAFNVAPGTTPEAIGVQIAQAIYSGLSDERPGTSRG